ncbi:hypothetical protein Q5H93_10160 [Hymenobacter sp. ASUV-10]|uniref:Carboxypeptidase-like regulatory domain-containing protein n=1 Tax=Hymenobacter aranciens TaxID=3063996 RepID=A0ABT9BBM7_9BACT|nr:hypothetical protein [Hymenobacter sp. ASUV-10]MDO7875094.1 hypothetical protein [Hymenobacter sp. ASUV-10]
MRFTTAAALLALLISGASLEAAATDLPTKARRPAGAPAKVPAKAPVAKAVVKAVKPQTKPVVTKRTAAPAAVVASPAKAPASPQATSAQVITYSGIVLGPNELALPGACVFVAGDRSRMVVTNAQGEFALTLPASQTGSLQVSYAGLAESQLPMATNSHTAMFVTLSKK